MFSCALPGLLAVSKLTMSLCSLQCHGLALQSSDNSFPSPLCLHALRQLHGLLSPGLLGDVIMEPCNSHAKPGAAPWADVTMEALGNEIAGMLL